MQNETIVDRVVARLKAQPLGDLITEEDLHDIVKQAIPKTFFEPRKVVDTSGYSHRVLDKEPLILEIMRDLMKDAAKEAVRKWTVENTPRMVEYWNKVMDEGLLKYVQQMQDELSTRQIKDILNNTVLKAYNEERQRQGMVPVYL